MNRRQCILFLIAFIISVNAYSQDGDSNQAFLKESVKNASAFYVDLMERQSFLFNGPEYVNYDFRINGHPFLASEYYELGEVVYFDSKYDSVMMKYDVHKNLVVIEYYDHVGFGKDLSLLNEKITSFTVNGHHIVHVNAQNKVATLQPGFYDLIFDEEIKIYVRRKKDLINEIEELKMNSYFLVNDKFFIIKDGEKHAVRNKRSLLRLYRDYKKPLKKYSKRNSLDFKNDFETALLSATEQYLNLTNTNEN